MKIKKILIASVLLILTCKIFSADTCIQLLQDKSVLCGFINYSKIKKTNSFIWLSNYLSGYLKNDNVDNEFDSVNYFAQSSFVDKNVSKVYFAIKDDVKNDLNFCFIVQSKNILKEQELLNKLNKSLKNSTFSKNYSLQKETIDNNNSIVKILTDSYKNNYYLLYDSQKNILFGGNKNFIDEIKSLHNRQIEFLNKDAFLVYSIPDNIRNKLGQYAKRLRNDKNAMPLELKFISGLEKIVTEISFSENIIEKSQLFFIDEKYLNRCTEFANQILPLLKFQLLSKAKVKKLTLVDTLKTGSNKEKKEFSFSFIFTKQDLINLN